ncbi:MAG: RnfABCDGE type electron transport complex subunit G [Gemmatimonadaceae bacterium]|jgi:electron transport complex protein RnfG
MSGHEHSHGAPAAPAPDEGSSTTRLLVTLAFFGALGGGILAYTYQQTLTPIRKFAGEKVELAVKEVLGGPAKLDTLFLVGDTLSQTLPAGQDPLEATKLFIGYDANGQRIGVAVEEWTPGFAAEVRLMVGFNPTTGALTGFKVLAQTETPGLGDKIAKDTTFAARFTGKLVNPLKGTKSPTTDPSTVQTITGATISSKAVIKVINKAVDTWKPRLDAYAKGGGQ